MESATVYPLNKEQIAEIASAQNEIREVIRKLEEKIGCRVTDAAIEHNLGSVLADYVFLEITKLEQLTDSLEMVRYRGGSTADTFTITVENPLRAGRWRPV